MMILKPIFFKL